VHWLEASGAQKLHREVRDESPTWPEWEFARYEAGRIEWPGPSQKEKGKRKK
jgi:hypothetical protein